MYTRSSIDKLLKSKSADSRKKLNNIVKKIMEEDHSNAFAYLMQKNYVINVVNENWQTAVHLAFYNNCCNTLFSIGLYLINTHDSSNYIDSNGLTYLHVACYMDDRAVAEKFLKDGMDVNLPLYLSFEGYRTDLTLLHFAVTQSSVEVSSLLLEYGASVESVDSLGRTPLHLACSVYELSPKYYGINIDIIKLLIDNKSNVNAKDKNNNTPLMCVFPDNYQEFMTFKTMNFYGVTMVLETLEKFRLLLQQDVVMNESNDNGDTILHLVIKNMRQLKCPSDHPIISFADTAHVEMVQLILSSNQKVNVNAKNKAGETPIGLAVASMSINIVKMLLYYGVDLSDLEFNHEDPTWFYHPLVIPDFKSLQQIDNIIALLMSHGFQLTFKSNLAILKFLIHDYDNCECGNVHDLPNNFDKRVYLVHLLQYGSPKHIRHVLKKALPELESKFEDVFINQIFIIVGEYLRYCKMGGIFLHDEVFEIIKNFKISQTPVYSLDYINSELDCMKNINLNNNITVYNVMQEDPNKIYQQIKDCCIDSKIDKFVCYKDIIEGHMAKAFIRIHVLSSGVSCLKELVSPSIPQYCCEKIVDYLSNEEILVMYIAIAT